MRPPTLTGVIERRLLLNYRVDPDQLQRLLPAPFRPLLVNGHAVAGTCLLRVGDLRPVGVPRGLGIRLEGAAHRTAVEWDDPDGTRTAVYIRRRETASRTAALVGGRVFPGRHHRARFAVSESPEVVHVTLSSNDSHGHVDVRVHPQRCEEYAGTTLFPTLEEASQFFHDRSDAFSTSFRPDRLDGLRMTTQSWTFEPATIEHARSSLFDESTTFPRGAVELDSAFLMRGVPARLTPIPSLAVTLRASLAG